MAKPDSKKRGPEAERVVIEGMDWGAAVRKALQKKPPAKAAKVKRKLRKP